MVFSTFCIALVLQATPPVKECTIGENAVCGPDAYCRAEWSISADGGTTFTCPAKGTCAARPEPATIELSLPIAAGESIYCAKGGLLKPGTSHSGCDNNSRFALDLASSVFDAPHRILAAADGTAYVYAGCASNDFSHSSPNGSDCNGGWGNYIRIEHANRMFTHYAHLSSVLINDGQKVKAGDIIGIEGSTGNAGSKHLHFSVHRGSPTGAQESIPFRHLKTAGGVKSFSEIVCGDWLTSPIPDEKSRLTSATAVNARAESFYFDATTRAYGSTNMKCPTSYVARGELCVSFAPNPRPDMQPIVYFHGLRHGSSAFVGAEETEFVNLAKAATAKGYTVIALPGEKGACTFGPSSNREAYCWPSAPSVVWPQLPKLADALRPIYRELKVAQITPWFVGFSNGGFFTTLLATQTKFQASGFITAHAGIRRGLEITQFSKLPILVLYSKDDTYQTPTSELLIEKLKAAQWPFESKVRTGAHALTGEDAENIIQFIQKASATQKK